MTVIVDRRSVVLGAVGAMASSTLAASAVAAQKSRFFQRVRLPIGLQLYALGDAPQKDLEGTLKQVAAIGYREIELPGLMGHEPARIRRAADAAGLRIGSVHIGVNGELSIRSDPRQLAEIFGALGTGQLVVPMFSFPSGWKPQPGEDLAAAITRMARDAGADMWSELAALLNERAVALKPHGIGVSYHNHSVEFMPIGSRTGWEILATQTNPALVHFEADVGWLVSAGVDPLAFFERYRGRVRQLHVKDVKRGFTPSTALKTDPTEVGSGQVDWARVLPAAYAAGARNFYVEQEPPFAIPRIEAAAKSYQYLAQLRA